MSEMLLEVESVSKSFGGLKALQEVSFEVGSGEVMALIGPNGAGKSTLLNIINGFLRPSAGRIRLDGKDVTQAPVHRIALKGVGRTFQKIRVFKGLSVLDNVRMAVRNPVGVADLLFRSRKFVRLEKESLERAHQLVELVGLADRAGDLAVDLPYGQQRLVEIARALAGSRKLLLLDEPGAGMNEEEMKALHSLITRIRSEFDVSILVVEHNVDFVLQLSDRIVVFDHGIVIAIGTPTEVIRNPKVIDAYLGGKCHD
ncbi:MAG: ABC transporter ATP-binding protein [Spirochaetia bacterium]|jgi:branched-chain amino acid transport system ATP-binding protein